MGNCVSAVEEHPENGDRAPANPQAQQSGPATKSWEVLVEEANKDKKGWRVWNDQILLCGASDQFKQAVTVHPGAQIPFNETKAWLQLGGKDHWFEIPLNTPQVELDTSLFITGRLFTTRAPKGLDLQTGDYQGPIPEGMTDKKRLIQKIRDNHIKHVFVLIEEHEFPELKSKNLLGFYKDQGLNVYHTPIEDFQAPSFETEKRNIETVNIAVLKGENCLVHCWCGTGRTGTIVVGAVSNLGVDNPIKYCRKHGKSTYLEIREQEEFLEQQLTTVTVKMMATSPRLASSVIVGHIEALCEAVAAGKQFVDTPQDFTQEENAGLRKLFSTIDAHGDDGIISAFELFDFTMKLRSRLHNAPIEKFGRMKSLKGREGITEDAIRAICGRINPGVLKVDAKTDSISFGTFLRLLDLRPPMSNKLNPEGKHEPAPHPEPQKHAASVNDPASIQIGG